MGDKQYDFPAAIEFFKEAEDSNNSIPPSDDKDSVEDVNGSKAWLSAQIAKCQELMEFNEKASNTIIEMIVRFNKQAPNEQSFLASHMNLDSAQLKIYGNRLSDLNGLNQCLYMLARVYESYLAKNYQEALNRIGNLEKVGGKFRAHLNQINKDSIESHLKKIKEGIALNLANPFTP